MMDRNKTLLYLFILLISLITVSTSFASDNDTIQTDSMQTTIADATSCDMISNSIDENIKSSADKENQKKYENNIEQTEYNIQKNSQKNIKTAQASTGIAFSKSYNSNEQTVSITAILRSAGVGISGEKLKITYNDNTKTFTTDKDGSVKQIYNVTKPGIQTIMVVYDGNNNYKASNRTETFNRLASNSNIRITLNNSKPTVGQSVNITTRLVTRDESPIANEALQLIINNKTYQRITDSDGYVYFIYNVTTAMTNNFTVIHEANDYYEASTNYKLFDSILSATSISFGKAYRNSNQTVDVTTILKSAGVGVAGEVITISFNNETKRFTTDKTGTVKVTYNVTKPGLQTITVKYAGSNKYASSNRTETFNRLASNSNIRITLNNTTTYVGQSLTIITRLVERDETPIANEPLILTLNNKTYNKKTNNEGYVNIVYNVTKALVNNFTVVHEANDYYEASSNYRTFNTYRWGTSDLIWKKYDTSTYTIDTKITLYSNEQIVAGEKLRIGLNNNITELYTDKDGVASVLFHLQDRGDQTLYIWFDQTDKYLAHSRNVTISSYKYNTTVNTIVNKTATVGKTLPVIAQLNYTATNGSSIKLSKEPVTVKINNVNYTGLTDSKGQYIVNYTPTTSGILNIKTLYNQGQFKFNTSQSSNVKVNVTGTPQASMELLTGSFNAKPGETVKLIAHLTDNGIDINGGQLVFKLNGVTLKDEQENPIKVNIKKGLAILEYKIPDTLSARTHNLTAVYASSIYGRVEMSTPMTIYKYETHIDINPTYTTNNAIQVKAQVVDQNNQALNKQTAICIKLNGKSYNLNTTTGTINYKITQTLNNGYYNISIISGENGKYLGSTASSVLVKTNTTIKTNYINNTLNNKKSESSGDIKTGTIMSILTGSSTVKPGDTLKLIAHISEDNKDVNGGQLVFKLNGVTLKDEKENPIKVDVKEGLAILEYKIPDTLSAKAHNLTAVYASTKYGRVELTTTLTMNRLNTHIAVNPTYTTSQTTNIKAQILDDNNQLINKKTAIVVKIDGKSYNMNNSNGIINFKVPVNLTKGIHQVTIISGDNGKYLASRVNTLIIRT